MRSALEFDLCVGFTVRREAIRIAVPATVFGLWAAHRSVGSGIDDHSGYMVSHTPTGWCLATLIGDDGVTYAEAVAIAQQLSESPLNVRRVLNVSGAAFMAQQIVGSILHCEAADE